MQFSDSQIRWTDKKAEYWMTVATVVHNAKFRQPIKQKYNWQMPSSKALQNVNCGPGLLMAPKVDNSLSPI